MARPIVYFARHGQTDWNAERRLQGQHDIPLNALGRAQATQCGTILSRPVRARGPARRRSRLRVEPARARSRNHGVDARGAWAAAARLPHSIARLMEMSFGRWEGYTFAELQGRARPRRWRRARSDKWGFVLPEGESYEQLVVRVRDWYESIERDTVVAAHGGVCRALIAHLGIEPKETASLGEIGQGCIYVFAAGGMTQHE